MKTIVKQLILLMVLMVIFFYSCNDETDNQFISELHLQNQSEEINTLTPNSTILEEVPEEEIMTTAIEEVEDQNLTNEFISIENNSSLNSNMSFDNSTIYEVALNDNSTSVLVANKDGYCEEDDINYCIAVPLNENRELSSNAFIAETIKMEENLYQVNYYMDDFNLIASFQLDTETGDYICNYGVGQGTADCINDVYSNHGWLSVWAWVQSAFIPATVAVIAAACMFRALEDDKDDVLIPNDDDPSDYPVVGIDDSLTVVNPIPIHLDVNNL